MWSEIDVTGASPFARVLQTELGVNGALTECLMATTNLVNGSVGQFSRRGLHKVTGEWTLVCLAWNVKHMAVLSLKTG